MHAFSKGKFKARLASCTEDVKAAQSLRHRVFFADTTGVENPVKGATSQTSLDIDEFDSLCQHVLIEDLETGQLLCCYRLLLLPSGAGIQHSYSAQFYDLANMASFPDPVLELGRFCIHPDWQDPDILRIAWAMMTRFVDENRVSFLFGCSSFFGVDATRYNAAFALLRDQHMAPDPLKPGQKAPIVVPFAHQNLPKYTPREAMLLTPPLLRGYLAMGGWVSDHAVIDKAMNTIHVFTGLEVSAIPAARARRLRTVAS